QAQLGLQGRHPLGQQATASDAPGAEPAPPAPQQAESTPPAAGSTGGEPSPPAAAKPKRQRQATAEPQDRKLSALDAAAKGGGEAGTPLSCQEMIDAMAAKGYWSSPAGRGPPRLPRPGWGQGARRHRQRQGRGRVDAAAKVLEEATTWP